MLVNMECSITIRRNNVYNTKRTHDKDLYLEENRYDNPKEIFQSAVNILKNDLDRSNYKNADQFLCVDVGCAAGEYLYYLNKKSPDIKMCGYDVVPELLDKAKTYVPNATFLPGSILDKNIMPENSADIITLLDVHGIFDDFTVILDNLLYWCKTGGTILIFGSFNPYPFDVYVQYIDIESQDTSREVGWNMHSKDGVANLIKERIGKDSFEFTPFELSFDLDQNPSDPLRTWTFKDNDGTRKFTNGLSIIVNRYFLKIQN